MACGTLSGCGLRNPVTDMRRSVILVEYGAEGDAETPKTPNLLARIKFIYVFFAVAIVLLLLAAIMRRTVGMKLGLL
jgi:hypothetical protein